MCSIPLSNASCGSDRKVHKTRTKRDKKAQRHVQTTLKADGLIILHIPRHPDFSIAAILYIKVAESREKVKKKVGRCITFEKQTFVSKFLITYDTELKPK